jgi:hypothetical protein
MDNVKKFYEALAKDTAMQERAKPLFGEKPEIDDAALDALVEFAAKEGYSFTADEARAYIKEDSGELSDDQLEAVAGGTCLLNLIAVVFPNLGSGGGGGGGGGTGISGPTVGVSPGGGSGISGVGLDATSTESSDPTSSATPSSGSSEALTPTGPPKTSVM